MTKTKGLNPITKVSIEFTINSKYVDSLSKELVKLAYKLNLVKGTVLRQGNIEFTYEDES